MTDTLIQRLSDEADLCRNDGATDVAKLLDDAVYALVNQAARLAAAEIVSAQPAAPAEPKGADGLPVSAPRLYADEEPHEPAAHADATEDELLDLEQALERRRILEEIKKVAEVHPADDMPTPFQSAWQQCCEEIFYRATEGQWHMDEDASRFAKNHAAPEPRQPMSACPHGVPHRWSCGECDTGVEMLAPAAAAPSVAPEPVAWTTLIEIDWVKRNAGRAGSFYAVKAGPNDIPLFAHPPRAPLTDAGIERAYRESQGQDLRPQDRKRVIDFARAVLAADHGIRGAGMSTDRKLLEDAAKAAGIEFNDKRALTGTDHLYCGAHIGWWNPLTDDGDALRLAVNRRIVIDVGSVAAHAYKDGPGVVVPLGDDPYAATRRAIVREAAAIGAEK